MPAFGYTSLAALLAGYFSTDDIRECTKHSWNQLTLCSDNMRCLLNKQITGIYLSVKLDMCFLGVQDRVYV